MGSSCINLPNASRAKHVAIELAPLDAGACAGGRSPSGMMRSRNPAGSRPRRGRRSATLAAKERNLSVTWTVRSVQDTRLARGATDMDTTTHERIEQLEVLVRELITEVRGLREESRREIQEFRAEFRAYVERQEERDLQTAALLKGISTRLTTVEHRVGAVEDRVTALEGAVGPQ